MDISNCKPKFYNLYITANSTYARINFQVTSGAVIQNCSITDLAPTIWGDHRATGFQMDHNIIAPGANNYVLDFIVASAGPVDAGQIAYNVFDSAHKSIFRRKQGELSRWEIITGSRANRRFDIRTVPPVLLSLHQRSVRRLRMRGRRGSRTGKMRSHP